MDESRTHQNYRFGGQEGIRAERYVHAHYSNQGQDAL